MKIHFITFIASIDTDLLNTHTQARDFLFVNFNSMFSYQGYYNLIGVVCPTHLIKFVLLVGEDNAIFSK